MDAGLVVVLVVLGVFLLVPLGLAWVSTNPRRWARVEAVLGRDPRREVRWAPWFFVVGGSVYVVIGIAQLQSVDDPHRGGWVVIVLGVLYFARGVAALFLRRHLRRTGGSVQTQVQRRAEPGRPRTGG
jgi:uncharacterized membrane protein (DUF2068 family)